MRIAAILVAFFLVLGLVGHAVGVVAAPAAGSDRYVAIIDARGDAAGGQVHIVDRLAREVVAHLERTAPDGIWTPDGQTLLLGSAAGLEWIDAATWQPVRKVATAAHSWWHFLPEVGQYALSPDGQELHAIVYHPEMQEGGLGRLAVQTVEVTTGQVRDGVVEVPPCAGRLLAPAPGHVWALCGGGPLSVVDVDTRQVVQSIQVSSIRVSSIRVASAFRWPDQRSGPDLLLITVQGDVLLVHPGGGKTQHLASLDFPADQVVPHHQVTLSPDGRRLYVGTGDGQRCNPGCASDELMPAQTADTLRVYSTATWRLARTFAVERPFVGLAATADGQELLLVSPTQQALTFLDAASGEVRGEIQPLGEWPSLVIAPGQW